MMRKTRGSEVGARQGAGPLLGKGIGAPRMARAGLPGLFLLMLMVSGLTSPAWGRQLSWNRTAEPRLTLDEPYRPGAFPVILVHGLTSTDESWEQMIRRIRSDPLLADRFQFWRFSYDPCVTLPLSASALRSAIIQTRWAIDPAGSDPALDRMVLVGQSQGGLLAKMAVQESGWTLWDAIFTRRPEEMVWPPGTQESVLDAYITRRVPTVTRVVFVATPHRGSGGPVILTSRLKNRLLSRRRREKLAGPIPQVVEWNGPEILNPKLRRVPIGAISDLDREGPFLNALLRTPIHPAVRAHSIIPQLGTWKHHLSNDGVVPYRSTHLDGVDSEVILPGPHIALDRPEMAAELGRILYLHLSSELH